jgi:hypothetical protein
MDVSATALYDRQSYGQCLSPLTSQLSALPFRHELGDCFLQGWMTGLGGYFMQRL